LIYINKLNFTRNDIRLANYDQSYKSAAPVQKTARKGFLSEKQKVLFFSKLRKKYIKNRG